MAKKIECRDCSGKLTYTVSNIKAPNEHRIRFYTCARCFEKEGINKTVVLIRKDIKTKDERTYNKLVIEFILAHVRK